MTFASQNLAYRLKFLTAFMPKYTLLRTMCSSLLYIRASYIVLPYSFSLRISYIFILRVYTCSVQMFAVVYV